ncbi:MAG: hypothetical protein JWP18_970, partial [Solirubrobacterales bacterium]|nr:hypothetical protein [Solirubrobacterales bacterium]
MCFSARADVTAAAVLAPVAVLALRSVRQRRELVLGALPALFALHQCVEGFVWLGLQGDVSQGVLDAATWIYLVFAQPVLPLLIPVGMLLAEPDPARRRWLWPLVALGAVVAVRMAVNLATVPLTASLSDHVVLYQADTGFGIPTAIAYVVAACAPALLSSFHHLRWFGVANLVGLAGAAVIREEAVTSLW